MMNVCPICGRYHCIHWPEHWVYRRGSTYYCGEQCLTVDLVRDTKLMNEVKKRRKREKKMINKITPDMRKKAAEIAISGGNPLGYLKECGSANPSASWQYIRQLMEKNDPETFAKLPDKLPKTAGDAMNAMKETADNFFSQCEDMGLKLDTPKPIDGGEWEKMETPESTKLKVAVIGKPETVGELKREKRYTVTAIQYPEIGEFYYDRKYKTIDWRTPEGEEVSMSPTGWKLLMQDMKEIMTVLGVEL